MLSYRKRFWMITSLLLTLTLSLATTVNAVNNLTDITGHWAANSINQLVEAGAINGYPDGSFKPDQAITRAEFAKMITEIFDYQSSGSTSGTVFPDTTEHWANNFIKATASAKIMNAFSDGNFKPDQALNRGQVATMISRILNITKEEAAKQTWSQSFNDISSDHWAYQYIELAENLDLFPDSYSGKFYPDYAVTRGEAAIILAGLSQLSVAKGTISTIDPLTGIVNIQTANANEPKLTMIVSDTKVLRNNTTASLDTLQIGDEITAIAASSGDAKFVRAYGEVTKDDLLSKISGMTKGKLTTDQVNSLVKGDWEAIKGDLKGGLYSKMIDLGLTPAEAESIMVQDWDYLDVVSRDHLAKSLSDYLGITRDFSLALLNRDLDKIKEYGKIELASAALSRLLGATESEAS